MDSLRGERMFVVASDPRSFQHGEDLSQDRERDPRISLLRVGYVTPTAAIAVIDDEQPLSYGHDSEVGHPLCVARPPGVKPECSKIGYEDGVTFE